jgi:hypothetical protein
MTSLEPEMVWASDTVGGYMREEKKSSRAITQRTRNPMQSLKKKNSRHHVKQGGKSMSSVSHGMRPFVELTIQTFDPAFGIGKLLFEIMHLLLTLSFALTEVH